MMEETDDPRPRPGNRLPLCASRTTPYVGRNLLSEFHDVTVHEKKPTEFVVIDQIQFSFSILFSASARCSDPAG